MPDAVPRSGFPPLVWVVVGVVLAKAFDLVSKLFRGGPGNMQQNMQSMMMQKMMEQMVSGKGGPMGGMGGMDPSSNPFAAMGNAEGSNPFAAMGAAGGSSAPAGFPFGNMPPPTPQPQQSSPAASSPGFPASGNFPASPAYDTTATAAAKQPEPASKPSPVEQKQSAAVSSVSASAPQQPRRSAFVDVDDEGNGGAVAAAASSGRTEQSSGGNEAMPDSGAGGFPGGFPSGFPVPGGQSDQAGQGENGAVGQGGEGGGGGNKSTMAMLERMMTDENLQKMLYPYLPEPMRNPETFKWMLSNPEYRQQLETMMEQQQGSNPAMNDLINNFNYDSPELREQLDTIGMTPDEVLQKIMAEPELAQAFSKPEVQAAIVDVTKDQMNITKYANNPEIMAVFNKMSTLFAPKP
jgi:hypothetical protein